MFSLYLMVISMTKGYSEQTAGAKLCIDLATDWGLDCITGINSKNILMMDFGAADGGLLLHFYVLDIF